MDKKTTQKYYDYTVNLYKVFWHGETRALHYGIWDKDTKTLHEALINTNIKMAEAIGVQKNDHVLDAGCGVGGSLFWLHEKYGVTGEGITISPKQIEKANELAERKGYESFLRFSEQDFTRTHFPEKSFDIVWATESVCHAIRKEDFLKEAYRILKPGGRIVVADGFLERESENQQEQKELENFLRGFALDNLEYSGQFSDKAKEVGFKNIVCTDYTRAILPTAQKMKNMSLWSYPLSKVTSFLRLTPKLVMYNNRTGIDQYNLFRSGVMSYKIFSAKK